MTKEQRARLEEIDAFEANERRREDFINMIEIVSVCIAGLASVAFIILLGLWAQI